MSKQHRIAGRDRIEVRGVRYEWSEPTQGYWSVGGPPVQLQRSDIEDMPFEIRLNDAWLVSGDQSIEVIFQNLTGENFQHPQPWWPADHTHANYLRIMEEAFRVRFRPGRVLSMHRVIDGVEIRRHTV